MLKMRHCVVMGLPFPPYYTHFNTLKKKKRLGKTLWKKVKLLKIALSGIVIGRSDVMECAFSSQISFGDIFFV